MPVDSKKGDFGRSVTSESDGMPCLRAGGSPCVPFWARSALELGHFQFQGHAQMGQAQQDG